MHESENKGHGRTEIRRCWAYKAPELLYKGEDWKDVASIARIERIRTDAKGTSTEQAYYISSLPAEAEHIARCARSHWAVENRLHWCLDVQFNDDQSRVRKGYAGNNLAIVRHIVMNLLRLNTTRKVSIKSKRMLAATIDEFRAELLGFMT
jgi:predicted transposase YbfD/YdcC